MKSSNKCVIVLAQFFMGCTSAFSIYMFLPLYPAMAKNLNVSIADMQITLSVFFWGLALSRLLYGPLAHKFSVKLTLIVAMIIFLIGSLICVFSEHLWEIVIGRLLQGIGMSANGVLGIPLIWTIYKDNPKLQIRIVSILSATVSLAPIIAPLFGEILSTFASWRIGFLLIFCIAGICAIIFWKQLTSNMDDVTSEDKVKLIFNKMLSLIVLPHFLRYSISYSIIYAVLIANLGVLPFILTNEYHFTQSCPIFVMFSLSAFCGGILTSIISAMLSKNQILLMYNILGFSLILIFVIINAFGYSLLCMLGTYIVLAFIVGGLMPNNLNEIISTYQSKKYISSGLFGFMNTLFPAMVTAFYTRLNVTSSFMMTISVLVCTLALILIFYTSKRLKIIL